MRQYVLSTLTEQIGISMDYKIRESALSWRDKGVLTDEDLENIDSLLPSYGPTLEDAKKTKQEYNKKQLELWLKEHPIKWKDNEYYGVSLEDQIEMSLNKMQYDIAVKQGQQGVLEWHSIKNTCKTFTIEDFEELSLLISSYIYPYCRYQEEIKKQIYSCTSIESVKNITIDYSSVGVQD